MAQVSTAILKEMGIDPYALAALSSVARLFEREERSVGARMAWHDRSALMSKYLPDLKEGPSEAKSAHKAVYYYEETIHAMEATFASIARRRGVVRRDMALPQFGVVVFTVLTGVAFAARFEAWIIPLVLLLISVGGIANALWRMRVLQSSIDRLEGALVDLGFCVTWSDDGRPVSIRWGRR